MNDSGVYQKAAVLVANGRSCTPDCAYPCCGMSRALPLNANADYRVAQQKFIDVFSGGEWHGHNATKEDRLIASLALCFAAAMAKAGDL